MPNQPIPSLDPLGREQRVLGRGDAALEIRASTDAANAGKFRGYAAKFARASQDLGGFDETIAEGAFAKTIREADVRLTINHNPDLVLARRRGQGTDTMRLAEDSIGLEVDAELAPTQFGRDVAVLLERGDVSQMSFRFRAIKDQWEYDEARDFWHRTLLEVALSDVSIVTYPAYLDTEAGLRAEAFSTLVGALSLTPEHIRSLAAGEVPPQILTPPASAGATVEGAATPALPGPAEPRMHSRQQLELYMRLRRHAVAPATPRG